MKILNSIKGLIGSAIVAATLAFAVATPASAQYYGPPPQPYAQPGYQGPGCPVAPYDIQNVLSGMYGVDGLQRPLNAQGFAVDVYGNCLTPAPVTEVFNYGPSPLYVNFLWSYYHYRYFYRPGFVHLWGGPGVHVYSGYGAIPYGHKRVIIQQNYHAPLVTVHPGNTTVVRPGYNGQSGVTTTVRPGYNGGVTSTVRPGVPAALPPASIIPPRAAPAAPSVFNRAPSAPRPTSIMPPRSSGGPSVFRRPGH